MRRIRYFFKEAFLSLHGNKSSTLIATVTIAFTMMLFGLFLLLYLNLNAVVGSLRKEIKIILYLREGLSKQAVASLHETLRGQSGISKVVYVSKEAALEDFRRSLEGNEILLKGLGDNPLPASFELSLDKTLQSLPAVQRAARQFENLQGVEDIQYGREWIENVNAVLETVRIGGTLIGLVLGLAAVVIISSTIGLTVWSRLADIEVLRLIGATRIYIQAPFLLEGAFMGLIGGAVSVLLLRVIYEMAKSRFAEASGLFGSGMTLMFLPIPWLTLFMIGGVGLGCAGSFISVRRFL